MVLFLRQLNEIFRKPVLMTGETAKFRFLVSTWYNSAKVSPEMSFDRWGPIPDDYPFDAAREAPMTIYWQSD